MRDATLQVERMTQGGAEPPRQRSSLPSAGRWARITEGEDGKYSWIGLKPNDEDSLIEDESWGKGDHTKDEGYAVEARHQSPFVLDGSDVWLTPAKGMSYFLFDYNPGVQWVKSFDSINFPARSSTTPGEGTLTFMEMDESGHFAEGQERKVFNGYKQSIQLNSSKLAQVQFGLEGKWWITGVDC